MIRSSRIIIGMRNDERGEVGEKAEKMAATER